MRRQFIDHKKHVQLIFRVDKVDAKGRPSVVTLGYDDTVYDVQEGMEFWSCWVPAGIVKESNG